MCIQVTAGVGRSAYNADDDDDDDDDDDGATPRSADDTSVVGGKGCIDLLLIFFCLVGAQEARDGSCFWILLEAAWSCAVLVASWIVMLSDSMSCFIPSNHLLFGFLLLRFPCT